MRHWLLQRPIHTTEVQSWQLRQSWVFEGVPLNNRMTAGDIVYLVGSGELSAWGRVDSLATQDAVMTVGVFFRVTREGLASAESLRQDSSIGPLVISDEPLIELTERQIGALNEMLRSRSVEMPRHAASASEVPEWADSALSKELPSIIARGESQELEFILEYPSNGRELGKEIAAFASTNAALILLGVANDGSVPGLTNMKGVEGRDKLLTRVHGLCNKIEPSITPSLDFAISPNDRVVLAISVPRGSQPIYLYEHVAYIRHLTESRPARPHEIAERHRAQKPSRKDAVLSRVAAVLQPVLVFSVEMEARLFSPWLEGWQYEFRTAAEELRSIALEDYAIEAGLSQDCRELASELEGLVGLSPCMGWGEGLVNNAKVVYARAVHVKNHWIDGEEMDLGSLEKIREFVITSSRKLDDLVERGPQIVRERDIEEFQECVAKIGFGLAKAGQFDLSTIHPDLDSELRAIGRELHLIETKKHGFGDGGVTRQQTVRDVMQIAHELSRVAESLKG